MDVCKACHEKDRNVTKCKYTMPMHIKYTGFISECDICGVKGRTVYVCYSYNACSSVGEEKNNENMSNMPR